MAKEIILSFLFLLLLNYLVFRIKKIQLAGFKPFVTLVFFNLKVLAGIVIWVVYTFYYKDVENNDVHKFYNDALVLKKAAEENPTVFFHLLFNRPGDSATEVYTTQMKNWVRNFDEAPVNENRTVIKLNALLMFVSFKTYFVHVLIMCFISLVGWVLAFNAIFSYANKQPTIIALLAMFLPSALFWASGVIKEPVLILGLGLCLAACLNPQPFAKRLLFGIIGALILLSVKFYVLVCLLPAAIIFFMFPKNEKTYLIVAKYIVLNALFLLVAFNIQHIIHSVNLPQMLVNKQQHSIKEAVYFNAGSRIDIPAIGTSPGSILKGIPVGIWNSLARPYLWESKNPMMIFSAIENIFVFTIILLCLWYNRWQSFTSPNLVLFLMVFTLSYFALIGICTPVIGNLVRYKAPVMPFFVLAFSILIPHGQPAFLKKYTNRLSQ